MRLSTILRILLIVGILMGLLTVITMALHLTDIILSIRERLREAPEWLVAGFGVGITLLLGSCGYWAIRFLRPRRRSAPPPAISIPPDPQQLQAMIERNLRLGAEVATAEQELTEWRARKEGGEFHITLLGEISTGKSSLIQALLPDCRPEISPVGGTTRQIFRHVWHTPSGDRVTLTDLPGLNEVGGVLSAEAKAEALRAQVVIYLSDGDLTQAQFQVVTELTTIGKPMLLALNKADRYTDQELTMLHTRLSQRVAGLPQVAGKIQVVPVVSGGMREVIKEYPDGRILRELRPIPANTHELRLAIQRVADRDPEMLDRLRDQAIFALAAQSLDQALVDRQREQADAMIASYSRKAVVGALAAVTPGMDLAVQGYLGYQLVKELGKIYQASLREVDIEQFLRSCDRHIIGATPILLTLTGNVLKSFPGLGTVAGGLCHAVAYGLIFDTLGRAVANTLEQRGELAINPAVQHFDTGIAQDLETRLRHWFKIVMAIQSRPPTSPTAEKAQPGI